MNRKKVTSLAVLPLAAFLFSCNQGAKMKEKISEKIDSATSKISSRAEQTIKDLGLVYVEEGAQDVITYEEVKMQPNKPGVMHW